MSILSITLISCYSDKKIQIQNVEYKKIRCDFSDYRIPNLCEDEKSYLDWARKSYKDLSSFRDLNRENLLRIENETNDIDNAAAIFYERAIRDPKNLRLLNYLSRTEKEYAKIPPDFSKYNITLAMVPGMFYKDNPETGADGKALRDLAAKIGIKSILVPILQTGTSEQNGEIICNFLRGASEDSPIIFASPSKGGADIKMAIRKCGGEAYFRKVRGWYNIGGLSRGSFAVNGMLDVWSYYLKARLYFLLEWYDWNGLLSLKAGKESALDEPMVLPKGLTLINVVGVPLFRHVTERAHIFYNYLMNFGPNDGFLLLADTIVPGAIVYPSWRNDHYFSWPFPEARLQAFFGYLVESNISHYQPEKK